MPERQQTPGEVDVQEGAGGNGAPVRTETKARNGSRTDSPRGEALFAPSVAPDPLPPAGPRDAAAEDSPSSDGPADEAAGANGSGANGGPAGASSGANGASAAPGPADGESEAAPAAPADHDAPQAAAPEPAPDAARPTRPSPTPRAAGSPVTALPPGQAPARPAAPAAAAQAKPAPDEGGRSDAAVDDATVKVAAAAPAPRPQPAPKPAAAPTPAAAAEATAVHPARSAETTQVLPRVAAQAPEPKGSEAAPQPAAENPLDQPTDRLNGRADPPTEQFRIPPPAAAAPPPPVPPRPAASSGPPTPPQPEPAVPVQERRRRLPLLIVAGVVVVLGLLYVADLLLSAGDVPRGVTVAGLELGGMSKADARARLQAEIEPRSSQPVQVVVGLVQSQIDPKAAGLAVDYPATIEQAGAQPLNPITRIASFFTTREVGVLNKSDERSVLTALEQIKPVVDQPPVEGTVRFEGTTPVAVPPVPGQQLDLQSAVGVLEENWASGEPVSLPLIPQPTITTDADVAEAIRAVATPAVSGPVTIQGEGATATLQPAAIAAALSFRADAAASPRLVPELDLTALQEAAGPQLATTERPGRDATLDFSTGAPVIVPSQDGRGVDYARTFQGLVPVLTGSGPRTLTAVYADQPATVTTEKLTALGITGEISSFTTGGFAADSGRNIRRAAAQINGMIVQPGETFSLNAATNPRNAANGYVEAGIIEDGHPSRGVGGGVSQVATTLYNAAYFAGMVDVEHREHSFYISRYPAAREATVFNDVIDVKFRNDGPTGVLIQTIWTPSSVTVKMFGTKRYEVTSEPGPRTNPTPPQTITIPPGQPCSASKGAPGFTTSDTRVMQNLATGEVTRKTRTVTYKPSPNVVCG